MRSTVHLVAIVTLCALAGAGCGDPSTNTGTADGGDGGSNAQPDAAIVGVCSPAAFETAVATGTVHLGPCSIEINTTIENDVTIIGNDEPLSSMLTVPADQIGLTIGTGVNVSLSNVQIVSAGKTAIHATNAASLHLDHIYLTSTRGNGVVTEGVGTVTITDSTFKGSLTSALRGSELLSNPIGSIEEAAMEECSGTPATVCTPGTQRQATCPSCADFTEVCDACGKWRAVVPYAGVIVATKSQPSVTANTTLQMDRVAISGYGLGGLGLFNASANVSNTSIQENFNIGLFVGGESDPGVTITDSVVEQTYAGANGSGTGVIQMAQSTLNTTRLAVRHNDSFGMLIRDSGGSHADLSVTYNEGIGIFVENGTDLALGRASATATDVYVESNRFAGVVIHGGMRVALSHGYITNTRQGQIAPSTTNVLGEGLVVAGVIGPIMNTITVADTESYNNADTGIIVALDIPSGNTTPQAPNNLFTRSSVSTTSTTAHGFFVGRYDVLGEYLELCEGASQLEWRSGVSIASDLAERDASYLTDNAALMLPFTSLITNLPTPGDLAGVIGPIM